MNMQEHILKSAQKEKSLIGIRTNMIESDKVIIGFVVKVEKSHCIINEIDEYGYLIGNTIIEMKDIINLDLSGRYQKRLNFIYNHSSSFDINKRVSIWKEGQKLLPVLEDLLKNKAVVTLYFNDDDYVTGIITKLVDGQLMIHTIGREGDDDGFSNYFVHNLTGLRHSSLEEQKIKLLYENRTLFYK